MSENDNILTELREWAETVDLPPLGGREMAGFLEQMRDNPERPVSWDVAMRLWKTMIVYAKAEDRLRKRLENVRDALDLPV